MSRLGDWLGVSEKRWTKSPNEELRPAKTAWDWLQLAVVPGALAVVAIAFNAAQGSRDAKREDGRAKEQARLAVDARRDDAVQAYVEQMSGLMLDRHLVGSKDLNLRAVARTLTLTALRTLDGRRKGQIIQFLWEAGLINRRGPGGADSVIALADADLRGVVLKNAYLGGVAMDWADLRNAKLSGASLTDASLVEARLDGASMRGANLLKADLSQAFLRDVDLEGASVREAKFGNAHLPRASLIRACLSYADFGESNLRGAKFDYAEGISVDFEWAKLLGASGLQSSKLTDLRLEHVRIGRRPSDWGRRGVGLGAVKRKLRKDPKRITRFDCWSSRP
jgi:uncharacterized protein YjbI with pentapeptide repeats